MRVDDWRKDAQPNRRNTGRPVGHRAGSPDRTDTDRRAGGQTDPQTEWPDAIGGTASWTGTQHRGVPRQPSVSGQDALYGTESPYDPSSYSSSSSSPSHAHESPEDDTEGGVGPAAETSHDDAAAETRPFTGPGTLRSQNPDTRWFTDPETRRYGIPEPRPFGQVAETRHLGRVAETRPFGQAPDAGRRGAGTPGTRGPGQDLDCYQPGARGPGQDPGGYQAGARGPGQDPDVYQDTYDVPWEESDESGHTHDPHEVTVQMDGLGRQLEDWLVQQAKSAPAQQESDGPVFVDESGRRRSRLRRFGILVGLTCAVYAVVIAATLVSGNSEAPWLPDLGEGDRPAGRVDTSPRPTDSADPSETASGSPSAGASAGESASATPGAGDSADPSAGVAVPGASRTPDARASDAPGDDSTPDDPDPEPDPPTPSATAPTTGPEPSTSESLESDGTGTGSDTDTAADSSGTDTVASGAAPGSSSPENTV